jgi:undecaprenyl-diphosphatase
MSTEMAATFGSALVLGIVEGLTEFIPVSSTGHLIFMGSLLGFQSEFGTLFEIVIQLGAIMAVLLYSAPKLLKVARDLPTDPRARRFVGAITVAFLPSAVIGLTLHHYIKTVLFSPGVVAISLIVGGFAILIIEALVPTPRYAEIENLPLKIALLIGVLQALSMVPGVSRAGATILGAVALGVDRRTATQFSFFLAIPTMLGATVVDLWKTPIMLNANAWVTISIGFAAAFATAMLVLPWLVRFVGRHDFSVFGWYRIAIGCIAAYLLFLR